jgi:lysophospholipid acyltransferase (LPLAT)-like uncharacterized protein
MKIRHRACMHLLGWCGTRLVRMLAATLRFDYALLGSPETDPRRDGPQRYIYALWHEHFLIPIVRFRDAPLTVLVSRHRDGELLGYLFTASRMNLIRGSSRRGGVAALLGLLAAARQGRHLALTPDGPRGPRRSVQPGILYLAAQTGWPIIPIGVGFQKAWRMPSWDCFAVPRPFTRVRCIIGEPLYLPSRLPRRMFHPYAELLRRTLNQLCAQARLWAKGHGESLVNPISQTPHQRMCLSTAVTVPSATPLGH